MRGCWMLLEKNVTYQIQMDKWIQMNPSSDSPISYEFCVPCPILTIKFSEGTRFTAAKKKT